MLSNIIDIGYVPHMFDSTDSVASGNLGTTVEPPGTRGEFFRHPVTFVTFQA